MKQYLILCRSATSAQRCAKLLASSLIRASVTKAPGSLTSSGCVYAVSLYNKIEEAVALLRRNNLTFGKVFILGQGGAWREVSV